MQLFRTTAPRAAAVLALALVLAVPAAAQQADAVLREFKPSGDYIVAIGGEDAPKAELYQSEIVPGFLLIANQLSAPVLVLPRERSVQTVSFMKLLKRDNGFIDVLADAELTPLGPFQVRDDEVAFAVDGQQVVLKQRPFLLGRQGLDDMLGYSPDYRRRAAAYTPDRSVVAAIKAADKPVKVRVYFGSWCGFCKEYVPKMLSVAQQLEGSGVAFEFYGLPQGFGDEPAAKRDEVDSVPTGIVYVGGREVGRLQARDWVDPEGSLQKLVSGS